MSGCAHFVTETLLSPRAKTTKPIRELQSGSRLSVVSAYFTIYAYEALKNHLDHIEHLDFLFGQLGDCID
jgi:hypothetical protein